MKKIMLFLLLLMIQLLSLLNAEVQDSLWLVKPELLFETEIDHQDRMSERNIEAQPYQFDKGLFFISAASDKISGEKIYYSTYLSTSNEMSQCELPFPSNVKSYDFAVDKYTGNPVYIWITEDIDQGNQLFMMADRFNVLQVPGFFSKTVKIMADLPSDVSADIYCGPSGIPGKSRIYLLLEEKIYSSGNIRRKPWKLLYYDYFNLTELEQAQGNRWRSAEIPLKVNNNNQSTFLDYAFQISSSGKIAFSGIESYISEEAITEFNCFIMEAYTTDPDNWHYKSYQLTQDEMYANPENPRDSTSVIIPLELTTSCYDQKDEIHLQFILVDLQIYEGIIYENLLVKHAKLSADRNDWLITSLFSYDKHYRNLISTYKNTSRFDLIKNELSEGKYRGEISGLSINGNWISLLLPDEQTFYRLDSDEKSLIILLSDNYGKTWYYYDKLVIKQEYSKDNSQRFYQIGSVDYLNERTSSVKFIVENFPKHSQQDFSVTKKSIYFGSIAVNYNTVNDLTNSSGIYFWSDIIYGDYNLNGNLEEKDVLDIFEFTTNHSIALSKDENDALRILVSDVDGNGRIESYDCALIMKKINGDIPGFPVNGYQNESEGDVGIVLENGNLLFLTYGEVLSFDLEISARTTTFGVPELLDENYLMNIGKQNTGLKIGMFSTFNDTVYHPVLKIPVIPEVYEKVVFNITINNKKQEIRYTFLPSESNTDYDNETTLTAYSGLSDERVLLKLYLNFSGQTKLSILDKNGKLIKTILNEQRSKGEYTFFWDGNDNQNKKRNPGIYIAELKYNDVIIRRKIMLNSQSK